MAVNRAERAASSLSTGMTTSGTHRFYPARSYSLRSKCSRFGELCRWRSHQRCGPGHHRVVLPATMTASRVLIIEDDPNVSEVVARYLEREGYQVETVDGGAVGLARALADPPDLVVLDLMLPSLGGLEVCRQLRAAAPVPVIMLTARGEAADRIIG